MTLAKTKGAADERPWREANLDAMALGLAWIGAALADPGGEDASRAANDYRAARNRMRESGSPATVDRLSALFQLAPFDEDLLLLALHAQLRAQPKVTAQTAQTTLDIRGGEALARSWERLAPDAPLRRYQLLDAAERSVSAATSLAIDERVARYLMGEDAIDQRIAALIAPVDGGPCPRRHHQGIEKLAGRLGPDARPLAMIVGPKHSGRRAAAATLARGFGLGIAEIRARGLEAQPDLLPVLAREAALSGFALLVDVDQPEGRRLFEERLAQFDGLMIAIAEVRHEFAFAIPALRLDPLDADDRVQLWHDALGPHTAEAHHAVAAVAQQFKFGPRAIAAAAAEGGDLWQACRERRAASSTSWRTASCHLHLGRHRVAAAMSSTTSRPRQRRSATSALVYGDHGFARKYPRGRGVSVLLSGPSGTGKTMAAEVIANDLNLDLYRIDLARIVSKYIGETEKNLRAVFDAAEASGAVLLFDEADALFGKRSEVKDSHDRYANIEVSYLLQRMEVYSGLAILATNMKGHLDAAFLRRIRYVIDVPFPDVAARRLIWQKAFPAEMPRTALDFDALARLDIAGGNIAVIAINAAFLAAADGAPLELRHIARAARAEYHKLDRELRPNCLGAG